MRLRAADGAFRAGRYDDARRLFEAAFALEPSPRANSGLQQVLNAEALACRDPTACGQLLVRVTPPAEIFVDDLSLGRGTELALPLSPARHRVRLEAATRRFPRVVTIVAGETTAVEIDLEEDGFVRRD